MTERHMIIDVALCENCNNCVLATKDEYVGNDFPGYTRSHPPQGAGVVQIERFVRGTGHLVDTAYLPKMCNHCADAPCMKHAPDAISRRPDGIVMIDAGKAHGRKDIVDSCPYGAIIWNEALQVPQQWIFDAHLLDQGWKEPRVQSVCPTAAFTTLRASAEEMARKAAVEGLEVLKPELGARPRIYYRNLHRCHALFIAGSVAILDHGIKDCVEGAKVTLAKVTLGGANLHANLGTDAFGDFKFDRIAKESGVYRLKIEHERFGYAEREIDIGNESLNLGEILLPGG